MCARFEIRTGRLASLTYIAHVVSRIRARAIQTKCRLPGLLALDNTAHVFTLPGAYARCARHAAASRYTSPNQVLTHVTLRARRALVRATLYYKVYAARIISRASSHAACVSTWLAGVVSHVAFNIDRVYNMWPCHVTYIEHLINLLNTQHSSTFIGRDVSRDFGHVISSRLASQPDVGSFNQTI